MLRVLVLVMLAFGAVAAPMATGGPGGPLEAAGGNIGICPFSMPPVQQKPCSGTGGHIP